MKFITLDEESFRKYEEESPYRSFTQTPEIAKLREQNGWTAYYLGVEDGGKLKAATMLIAKPTFLGKSTFFAPGGPLLDLEDTTLTNFFFKKLKSYLKSHNGYVLHIDPNYELIERTRDGAIKEGGFNHQKAINNLKNLGFTKLKIDSTPRYQFALSLDNRTPDQLLADMKRNTRNHIRKAEKMGVKTRELKREELSIFKKITESTSVRRHFTDKPLSYYEQMYDLFHDRGEVMFIVAEAPVDAGEGVVAESEGVRSAPVAGVAPDARGGRPKESSEERASSFFRDDDGSTTSVDGPAGRAPKIGNDAMAPLSVAMFILHGDEVIYLFSGSDEKYMKEYNAQYLIQWHMIKHAATHGFKTYNFYGINGLPDRDSKDYGIYDFKKGFTSESTGRVIELIGDYELPISPFFCHLHRLLSALKKH